MPRGSARRMWTWVGKTSVLTLQSDSLSKTDGIIMNNLVTSDMGASMRSRTAVDLGLPCSQ